jgi:diguanylate cyclase (GGDEF)-like protein
MNAVEQFLKPDIRLPSPPAIAVRLIEAVKSDNFSFGQLGSIIQSDPALSGRILRLANSQLYAPSRTVGSIDMAVAVLGVNTLKNIALSFTLPQMFQGYRGDRFDFNRLWRRSITAAVAGQLISQEVGFKSDETFIASLLQDIGVGVMFILAKDQYLAVLDEKATSKLPVTVVEKQIFGFDHQEVGAQLLKMWGLPECVYMPIRHHHETESAAPEFRPLCRVLHASDRLSAVYHGSGTVKNLFSAQEMLAKCFSLDEERVRQLIDNVAAKSIELISQFNIDPGQLKPFSEILQEANEELSRLNMSYEMLLVEHKEAKQRAERLALDLKAANERLRDAAFRDGLTGLFNRRYFQEAINSELVRAERHNEPFGLIILDIDDFKAVNDRYDHQTGDSVLTTVARQLIHYSRRSDIVVRYGGDEFAIILPETNLTGAAIKGEAVRKELESIDIKAGAVTVRVTISVGVSAFDPAKPLSKDRLIVAADRALYRSKREGRNRVTVWSPENRPGI